MIDELEAIAEVRPVSMQENKLKINPRLLREGELKIPTFQIQLHFKREFKYKIIL
jgi:hypothetical protein